jgi:hypothetical protein
MTVEILDKLLISPKSSKYLRTAFEMQTIRADRLVTNEESRWESILGAPGKKGSQLCLETTSGNLRGRNRENISARGKWA